MPDKILSSESRAYTPPLAYKALTPIYDLAISALTREGKWRRAFVREIAPHPTDKIVDIGSGTGTLAKEIHKIEPLTDYLGIDPDTDAVNRARKKAAHVGSMALFKVGFFSADSSINGERPNKIISSLVLHQVPLAEKRRIISDIFETLPPGGKVHIADYGYQQSVLMRFLFRISVQAVDGINDTQPNAEGIIPKILELSGFSHVLEVTRIRTLTGSISIYSGEKPKRQRLAEKQ